MAAPPLRHASAARIALVPVALALALGTYVASRYRTATPPPAPTTAADADADAGTIACMEGYEPIQGEGCLALPREGVGPPLLVYLHGMYDGDAPAQEIDRTTRVAKRATARGFAVLALRGRKGQCNSTPEYASWYCWPSNDRTAGAGPNFVAGWSKALEVATARTRARRRYVLGFSNGGYFAVLLATRSMFRADAFAIAGAGIVRPYKPPSEMVPLVLVSGDEDPSQPDMLALDQALAADRWPHDAYGRDGGHALTDSDIDLALTFFTRSESEKVPLAPPIVAHVPHAVAPDAAASDGAATTSATSETTPTTPTAAASTGTQPTAETTTAPESPAPTAYDEMP